MRREPNYLMLGATVAAIAAMFLGVLLFLAGAGGWGRSYQNIRVTFAHDLPLPKLMRGAEVTCGGMPVGKVTRADLEVLPREGGLPGQDLYIVVDALVDEQVGLRRDCKIRAEGPPLGGGGTLVIVHRGLSSDRLADGATVEGMAPAGLNAVVGTLGDKLAGELDDRNPQGLLHLIKGQLDATSSASLIFKLNAIADDLAATSGRIKQQLDPEQRGALMARLNDTLADIKDVTGALRTEAEARNPGALLSQLHAILSALGNASQDAAAMLQESRPTIQATLNNVQGTSRIIKDNLLPSLMAQVDPSETGSLLSKLQAAADKANVTLENVRQMSDSAKNLFIVNEDSIDATIGNLRETSEHLRAASREIRRNPWKLLYQPSKTEVQQESIADAARSFSDAAGKLDAAFARLEAYVRSAGASLPADDPQLKDMQERLSVSLKNLTESEKRFWELFLSRQH